MFSGSLDAPINAVMSSWSEWTECSQSCGPDGTTQRSRICDSDWENGGEMCETNLLLEGPMPCNNDIPCPGRFWQLDTYSES